MGVDVNIYNNCNIDLYITQRFTSKCIWCTTVSVEWN